MRMRVQSLVSWVAVIGMIATWCSRSAVGQELAFTPRTPRFLYSSSATTNAVEMDVTHSAVLGRVVSLHVGRATIARLLAEIQRQTGLTFAYNPHFPATRFVTLEAESITVAAALGAILIGTGVDVVLTRTGHVWLTESEAHPSRAPEGAVGGKITDKQNGNPIIGATVVLEPTGRSATTASDGYYRFANLSAGKYTVRARYIGYESVVASVVVRQDQEVTVDFRLEKSAHVLEDVVTTGTVVPTAIKALPTPVSVIDENDIALTRPHSVQELFRQAVPTAVSWDYPASPAQTPFAVRGASTLAPGTGQMKVLVDGIDAAWGTFAAIDPRSIERIEVLRGPQAAAIYGSDAIGGVVQVFTKRGDSSLTRPQLNAEAAVGLIQTPYAGHDGVLRQTYMASIRGGAPGVSYNFGSAYSRTGDYLPNGEQSKQSNPSAYGGLQFTRGVFNVDVSGRYYTQNVPTVFNPELAQTGYPFYSKPFNWPTRYQNQTIGIRVGVAPKSWWQHTFTAGVDRYTLDLAQSQRRLTTIEDTLFAVQNTARTKTSIGYNTSVRAMLSHGVLGILTVGLDHYALPINQFVTLGALNTTGTIRTTSNQPASASRSITNNTGYFAQAQIGLRDAFFLTGGIRAERNSDFGDSLGTPISPRLGLSYAQLAGTTTLKLRGSYGRSIRPPTPGQKFAIITSTSMILANPQLGPERQRGWDIGLDATIGGNAFLGLTYYDQIADGLIQVVPVQSTPVPTTRYQNVGRVTNAGVEVEASLSVGLLQVKGQYGYTRSRIDQLAPGYTGDLRVGDQALATPKHTAGASATFSLFTGTSVGAGVTYVGSWNYYDNLAQFRCFGHTGPCPPSNRDYIISYPGFVRLNASISQRIGRILSGYVSVTNLTNNERFEVFNGTPVMGRITTVGLELQY
jgi:iron complex outermembrane recepter protein